MFEVLVEIFSTPHSRGVGRKILYIFMYNKTPHTPPPPHVRANDGKLGLVAQVCNLSYLGC